MNSLCSWSPRHKIRLIFRKIIVALSHRVTLYPSYMHVICIQSRAFVWPFAYAWPELQGPTIAMPPASSKPTVYYLLYENIRGLIIFVQLVYTYCIYPLPFVYYPYTTIYVAYRYSLLSIISNAMMMCLNIGVTYSSCW